MARTQNILLADGGLGPLEADLLTHFRTAQPHWTLRLARTSGEAGGFPGDGRAGRVVLGLSPPPGETSGASLYLHIRRCFPTIPVILLAGSSQARLLRDTLLAETTADHMAGMDWIPEGVFFREDLSSEGAFTDLENLLIAGLEKYGRVANDTGILVTHGTDTMAWGFAYLRYALRDLRANVAMTGSQIPLGGYFSDSDALGNLRTAAFLLNRLRPARLFAVFNDGRSVFSGRLTKYRKWGEDAFEGRVIASGPSGGGSTLRKDWVYIPYTDQRLKHLHLIRTGGTIESQREAGSAEGLKPTGDFVWKYLTGSLGEFFEEARRHDLFALDSSNMSFEEWAQIARVDRIHRRGQGGHPLRSHRQAGLLQSPLHRGRLPGPVRGLRKRIHPGRLRRGKRPRAPGFHALDLAVAQGGRARRHLRGGHLPGPPGRLRRGVRVGAGVAGSGGCALRGPPAGRRPGEAQLPPRPRGSPGAGGV